mmetsp:Transcript_173532/g.556555  ORF Transcript_173532/g.556555 Transcript_173532/m.556555 type:complete len:236 (+) Transcript_173532:1187-1894(+)
MLRRRHAGGVLAELRFAGRVLAEQALVTSQGHLARLHPAREHQDVVRGALREGGLLRTAEGDEGPLPPRRTSLLDEDFLDVAVPGVLRPQHAILHAVRQRTHEDLLGLGAGCPRHGAQWILPEEALILSQHDVARLVPARDHQLPVARVLRILRLLLRGEGDEGPLAGRLAIRLDKNILDLPEFRELGDEEVRGDVGGQGADKNLPACDGCHGWRDEQRRGAVANTMQLIICNVL